MSDWRLVKLGDLASKIGSGITPRGGSDIFVKEGVLFLRSQNIRDGKISPRGIATYIPHDVDENMQASRVQKGDILYNITGASIGRSAVYSLGEPANVNQHVCIIRLEKDNPHFINYILSSYLGKKELRSFQAGGNREGLNYKQLASFKFFCPERDEQDKIVDILQTLDEYLWRLNRKIDLKKSVKKGLASQLFKESQGQALKEIREVTRLIKDGTHGTHKSYEEGIPLLSAKDVSLGRIHYKNNPRLISMEDFRRLHKTYSLQDKDIVLTIVGTIGRVAIIRNYSNNYTFQRSVAILRFAHDINPEYAYHYMSSNRFQQELRKRESKGAQGGVYLGALAKIKIPVPSVKEQQYIADVLSTADREVATLERIRDLASHQRKYLIDSLVTGKIKLKQEHDHARER